MLNQDAINALGLLSDREREIAVLTAQGLSNDEIAEKLSLSMHTVKTHRWNIFRRLNIKKNTQLTAVCVLAGLVTDWREVA